MTFLVVILVVKLTLRNPVHAYFAAPYEFEMERENKKDTQKLVWTENLQFIALCKWCKQIEQKRKW